MGKYTIFYLFDKPRRGMQARKFTTNVPKILDLKSSSEQIFFRTLSLGAPDIDFANDVQGFPTWHRLYNTVEKRVNIIEQRNVNWLM